MAHPAFSTTDPKDCSRASITMSYKDFKEFFFELEKFKSTMHGAPKGTYTGTFVLHNRNAELELGLNVVRSANYAKRPVDAPRAMPPGSLRLDENAKFLAQQALQKAGVKRAFEAAFPGETHGKVQTALTEMVTSAKLGSKEKARVLEMLRAPRAKKRFTARALDVLWACTPDSRDRLSERDTRYTEKRAHFERLNAALRSDPPRIMEVPTIAALHHRVHGNQPSLAPPPAV